ncbi:uncharacterized protein N7529_003884 [Penicillium soppii]|uniref:uncharacterized protein n=1 Tax=Penicillium soppii TaxID=69789 RepID=UPI0025465C85|nr:uncharacterized protein N7529_003884 [Penicillium soppii]KAJ5871531.1 hypothetical protein N7529_003884 [Penicillium soppii]
MAALLSNSARVALRSGASATSKAGAAGLTFARGKATLPDLSYDYGALEPSISGKIMEIHHKNHHNTYVTNYNNSIEQLQEAQHQGNIAAQIALKPAINFNGGAPSGALSKAIDTTYGGLGEFQSKMNAALASIQGSGWAWLVKDKQTGQISIRTYANQDPVVGQFEPLLGIDAWEHAYYLQYQNRKVEYFSAIWDVINWKAVEKRFS